MKNDRVSSTNCLKLLELRCKLTQNKLRLVPVMGCVGVIVSVGVGVAGSVVGVKVDVAGCGVKVAVGGCGVNVGVGGCGVKVGVGGCGVGVKVAVAGTGLGVCVGVWVGG